MAQGKLIGLFVVIQTLFAGVNQFRHHGAHYQGVFILISAGTVGQVEALHVGFVIDWNPIIRAVIKIADPPGLVGYLHAGHPLGAAVSLGFPLGFGELVGAPGLPLTGIKRIGIDPMLGIALRILTADQKHVAGFRAIIAPDIAVGGMITVIQIVVSFRRWAMHHLVPQSLGFDITPFIDALGHLIDFVRVRAGGVNHHRCVYLGSVFKRHPQHLVVLTPDRNHLGVE